MYINLFIHHTASGVYVCTIACYESDRCPSQPQLMSAAKIEAMLDPVREMLNELKQKSAHGQTIGPETEQKLCEKATIHSDNIICKS